MNAEAGAGLLLGFGRGLEELAFVSMQRPGTAYLADKSGADSGVANAGRDIPDYLIGNLCLGLGVYLRTKAGCDVVAGAHDYVETGNPRDTGQGSWVAADAVDGDINDCAAAGFPENHGLIDSFLLVQQAHVIQVLVRMVAEPAEVMPVHRLIRQSTVASHLRLGENAFAVNKKMFVGKGDAQFLAINHPQHGLHFSRYLGYRHDTQSSWRYCLRCC